jgi:hypothetical protein
MSDGCDSLIDGGSLQGIIKGSADRLEMQRARTTKTGKKNVRDSDHGIYGNLVTQCTRDPEGHK